eukprot:742686-Pleurochrysis_carterae.AAC.3
MPNLARNTQNDGNSATEEDSQSGGLCFDEALSSFVQNQSRARAVLEPGSAVGSRPSTTGCSSSHTTSASGYD